MTSLDGSHDTAMAARTGEGRVAGGEATQELVTRELRTNRRAVDAAVEAIKMERCRLANYELERETLSETLRLVAEEAVKPLDGSHDTAMAARTVEGRAGLATQYRARRQAWPDSQERADRVRQAQEQAKNLDITLSEHKVQLIGKDDGTKSWRWSRTFEKRKLYFTYRRRWRRSLVLRAGRSTCLIVPSNADRVPTRDFSTRDARSWKCLTSRVLPACADSTSTSR